MCCPSDRQHHRRVQAQRSTAGNYRIHLCSRSDRLLSGLHRPLLRRIHPFPRENEVPEDAIVIQADGHQHLQRLRNHPRQRNLPFTLRPLLLLQVWSNYIPDGDIRILYSHFYIWSHDAHFWTRRRFWQYFSLLYKETPNSSLNI